MIKRIINLLFFVLINNTVSLPQEDGLIIGDNFRIFPSNTSQTEVFITKHPTNTNILFGSANTIQFQPTFFVSEGVYVSTDGGQNWFGSDTCKGSNIFFHGGDPSIAIDKNGTFILTRKGTSSFQGIYSHYSTDNGLTWSNQKTISTDDIERATTATDIDPNSSYYGRTYSCWAKLFPPYSIGFSYSNDGAQNWTTPVSISNVNLRRAGGEIALGPNNEVYICWAGITSVSPFTEVNVGFASSSNGGANWNINENAFAMNGIVGIIPEKQSIRVNGLPRIAVDLSSTSTRGNIYIVTSQKNLSPSGSDPDIILRKSTNGGQSWSDGIRVNQDALSNAKYQFFPGITIDQFGGVNIIFYDDRNTTSDSSGVFLARSTDAGSTWIEHEISDHNFKPIAIGGLGQGYMGDNIDITSVGNKLFPVWMDNRTGVFQMWSVPIEFTQNTSDEPPFILEPVSINEIKSSSFTVSFNTLRKGDSQIKFGYTNELELDSIKIIGDTTFHIVKVDGLQDSTLYFFNVSSSNSFGTSVSQIYSVKTLATDDTSDQLPFEYKLLPNYPNPFNPGTVIEFDLAAGSIVSLKIFDVTGKEVVSLLNDFREAGNHKVNFEASKYSLSSGVYFYTLSAHGFTQTKSMMLLK
jgi:hypothetical protein